MCEKCTQLDKEIEHYRQISRRMSDELTQRGIESLIAEREAQKEALHPPPIAGLMADTHHRACNCGAVYDRSETMASSRQIGSFECAVCGATLESWNTSQVTTYRLVSGPIRPPKQ